METDTEYNGINLHLESKQPVELDHLISSLGAFDSRYRIHARQELGIKGDSKLLVSSIKPGSIDIFLMIPDIYEALETGAGVLATQSVSDATSAAISFSKSIGRLIKRFESKPDAKNVSIRDCDDAVNIVKPVVESGGSLDIKVHNGDVINNIYVDKRVANKVTKNAVVTKAELQMPKSERVDGVTLIWKTFDKSHARTEGQRSPDKGVIEDIDPFPKAILFMEDEAGLKKDILESDENPMKMVYYVDVEISRVNDKIKAYRIVGYDGADPIDE